MALGLLASVHAQWNDMTSYVTNPNFNGSTDGWVVNYNGNTAQNYGYQSANYSNSSAGVYISGFAEAWRPNSGGGWGGWGGWGGGGQGTYLGNGSIHQLVKGLPSGSFKLEADVIAVDQGGRNNPVNGVFLFIKDSKNEEATEVATDNEKPQHFSVELETTENSITIGIKTEDANANWIALDNIKLYWQGEEVKATGLALNPKSKEISIGESFTIVPTIYPSNATFKTVEWSSDYPEIASVDADGVVTGHMSGNAIIRGKLSGGSNNLIATCKVTVTKIAATSEEVVINEIQASNIDMFMDPSFNYGGWIEIHNPTDKSVTIAGCYLSDDPDNLKKAIIGTSSGALPAHGYLTLWLDHYSRWAPTMIDFKLDCDGGTVYITDPDGNVITSCTYPEAISRTSYARKTDAGNEWGVTAQPTPGESNNSSVFAEERLEAPVIDHPGGMVTSGFTAKVTIPKGTTLRYTTDGSTPTLENGETSKDGGFPIDETTVLRLRLFQEGKLPSPVVTRSFIFRDRNYTLPIVSIVTDNDNIYSADYGIFVKGNGNGRPGNGQSGKCNWNMDWERPINFEYFTADGASAVNLEMGMESSGGWSRAWEPHSSNLKASKRYEGINQIDYPFFSDRPYSRHKALKLRNGGNDNNSRTKDAAIQQVVRTSGLYVETQGWNPVHEFINGKYIGLLNMREPNNKNYGYMAYGLDTDNMDQWKMSPDSGYVQQAGTKDSWDELMRLSRTASKAESYEKIKQLLDIEEYINYVGVEFYCAGTDWPKNNIKGFRDRDNGRFRFILFDLDGAFATSNPFTWFESTQTWTFDQLYGVQDIYSQSRLTLEIEFVTLFLNLLKNADFKKQFIDQFSIMCGSVFEPGRVSEVINDMVNHVSAGLALDGQSPSSANNVRNTFSASRQTQMTGNMRNYFGLSAGPTVTLSSDTEGARLLINDLPVPTGKFGGQLFNPVKVKAVAPAGYKFVGWFGQGSNAGNNIIQTGDTWYYYDQGSLDGKDWKAANYSADGWQQGQAPLGFYTSDGNNGRGYRTFLDYGGNTSNKRPTYYFRKQINLNNYKSTDKFTLNWTADDGFVIYVNGTEAGRYYMNNTPNPTFNSYADSYAPSNPESGEMTLDASLFKNGQNIIAVELHNCDAGSTDIYWDCSLSRSTEERGSLVSTDIEYTLPSSGKVTLVATYEPLSDDEMADSDARPVKINEVSAANDIYINDNQKKEDWIELYNTTDQPIDIAGMFISDNLEKPEKVQISAEGSNASTIIPAHIIYEICNIIQDKNIRCVRFLHKFSHIPIKIAQIYKRSFFVIPGRERHKGICERIGEDGGNIVYVFEQPTIAKHNQFSMYAALWDEPGDIQTGMKMLQKAETQSNGIIYDTAGRQVGTTRSFNQLPHGIYIINGRKVIK